VGSWSAPGHGARQIAITFSSCQAVLSWHLICCPPRHQVLGRCTSETALWPCDLAARTGLCTWAQTLGRAALCPCSSATQTHTAAVTHPSRHSASLTAPHQVPSSGRCGTCWQPGFDTNSCAMVCALQAGAGLLSSVRLFYFVTYLPHRPDSAGEEMPWQRSRSSQCSAAISMLRCYCFDFHWEHHRWPYAPWWQLGAYKRLVRAGQIAV
jgi:hypothetical protein